MPTINFKTLIIISIISIISSIVRALTYEYIKTDDEQPQEVQYPRQTVRYRQQAVRYRQQEIQYEPQEVQYEPEPIVQESTEQEQNNDDSEEQDNDSKNRDIILRKDRQGHFRGTALINGIPMPFLIDTGATETVIPVEFANKAHLPVGNVGSSDTANGTAVTIDTKIKKLTIGKATIKDVEGHVNYSLDEALIGMNTLKMFKINISGDTMTLTAGHGVEIAPTKGTTSAVDINGKKAPEWKKSVNCDSHGENCKTAYTRL